MSFSEHINGINIYTKTKMHSFIRQRQMHIQNFGFRDFARESIKYRLIDRFLFH